MIEIVHISPFQHWLRRKLEERKWTQDQLARKLSISNASIATWLRTGHPPMNVKTVIDLASVFEEDFKYLSDVVIRSMPAFNNPR